MPERFPLSWPDNWARTPRQDRKRARWGKSGRALTIADALDRLAPEVERLADGEAVLSTNIVLRIDGLPRSNQPESSDQGVALYFKLKKRDCVLACDRWDRVADNIAAVAAHIAAIRGQERWGVGTMEQAFRGYMALPDPASVSARSWWEELDVAADATTEDVRAAWRDLLHRTHPDKGGSRESFDRVQSAWRQFLSARGLTQ